MTYARTRVKVCGMTHPDDVDLAVELGVDAVGFIFAPSPRFLQPADAVHLAARVPVFVETVAVFVDPDAELYAAVAAAMPRMIPQFCGSETPQQCSTLAGGNYLKVFHVDAESDAQNLLAATRAYPDALPIFDTKIAERAGGSGIPFDWNLLQRTSFRAVIAGGLNPQNVAACIRQTRPFAVDVRSGVEREGRKDRATMTAFLAALRDADKESSLP